MRYEASDPYSIATFVERSAVFLDGQVPTAMAWKQECIRIAVNEPDTIIYASHIQADEPHPAGVTSATEITMRSVRTKPRRIPAGSLPSAPNI